MKLDQKHTLLGRMFVALILVMLCVPSLRLYRPVRIGVRQRIAQQTSYAKIYRIWAPSWADAKERVGKNFEFHDPLRKAFSKLKFFGFNATTSQDVQKGKDGWLFYTTKEERRCMHHTHPFSGDELHAWGSSLENWRARLAAEGIQFLVMVAPDKHTIYDTLAPAKNHEDTPSRLDQFYGHLQKHTAVKYVDVRSALLSWKLRQQIYYKTDTHWNDVGAFVAFQELAKSLRSMFPRVPIHDLAEQVQEYTSWAPFDLARLAGVDDVLLEQILLVYPKAPSNSIIEVAGVGSESDASRTTPRINSRNPTGSIPRLLMLRDSFGTALLPFVAANAAEGIFLWTGQLDWSLVEKERPSIVIYEIVERHLQFEQMCPQPV